MSFEGQQMQGSAKIMEKINTLGFQKIAHLITAVDCQPTFDGGILVNVLGQLQVRKMGRGTGRLAGRDDIWHQTIGTTYEIMMISVHT